jgi:hypothetical protein
VERRVPREIWVKRVARWRESGQTAPGFAAAHGLNVDRLQHWGRRLEKERYAATPASKDSPPRKAVVVPFVEVERAQTTVTHAKVA